MMENIKKVLHALDSRLGNVKDAEHDWKSAMAHKVKMLGQQVGSLDTEEKKVYFLQQDVKHKLAMPGPAGTRGQWGAAGRNGINGAQGTYGATGPRGIEGVQGKQGPAGILGRLASAAQWDLQARRAGLAGTAMQARRAQQGLPA